LAEKDIAIEALNMIIIQLDTIIDESREEFNDDMAEMEDQYDTLQDTNEIIALKLEILQSSPLPDPSLPSTSTSTSTPPNRMGNKDHISNDNPSNYNAIVSS